MLIQPLVSIIIANYNGEKSIVRCLQSILKNTTLPFEIIVVDSNSKNKSRQLIKNFKDEKRLKLICLKSNKGPAFARNLGTRKSKGKYLMFLDYDTLVAKDWLTEVIPYLEKHPEIGGGQLKLLRMDRRNVFDSSGEKLTPFGFLAERAQEAEDRGQFDKVENIFSGKGAAMIVRKNIFEKVGGFDEDYFMYWEEPDLTWRIWKVGYKFVFLPMGTVYHAYGSINKPVSKHWTTQITYFGCRNQIATIIKNAVGLKGLQMLLTVLTAWLGLCFFFLLKGNFKKASAVLKALIWLPKNIRTFYHKRREFKKRLGKNFSSDPTWFPLVEDKRSLNWYLGKGFAYVFGKPY